QGGVRLQPKADLPRRHGNTKASSTPRSSQQRTRILMFNLRAESNTPPCFRASVVKNLRGMRRPSAVAHQLSPPRRTLRKLLRQKRIALLRRVLRIFGVGIEFHGEEAVVIDLFP